MPYKSALTKIKQIDKKKSLKNLFYLKINYKICKNDIS